MNITIEDLRDEIFKMAKEWQDAVNEKLATDIYKNELKKAASRDRRASNKRIKRLFSDAASWPREMEERARYKESCRG